MKLHTVLILISLSLTAPSAFAQGNGPTSAVTPAPIPEEARKHFVMGTTLFKDAKTPDDFVQVENQFKQAVDLAPRWPDARYNLALIKGAAGDYSGAMTDLKLYLQFKLPEADARAAKDKLYVFEAKVDEATQKFAKQQQASAAEEQKEHKYQDEIGFLAGTWAVSVTWLCDCPGNGMTLSDTAHVTITGRDISVAFQNNSSELIKGEIIGEDHFSINWILTHGDSCPNLPDLKMVIFVTPDKSSPLIKWNGPSHNCTPGSSQSWNWDYHGAYSLTK